MMAIVSINFPFVFLVRKLKVLNPITVLNFMIFIHEPLLLAEEIAVTEFTLPH